MHVIHYASIIDHSLYDSMCAYNYNRANNANTCIKVFLSLVVQARVIETQYFTYICTSKHRGVVLVLLYGYKALIQVTAVILALKTRKVKVHGLDDYREIILGTYFSSFLLIIIIIFAFTIKELINIYAILSSSSFFIGTTMIVALIFVPKVCVYMRINHSKTNCMKLYV